jgi:hypothetical protein
MTRQKLALRDAERRSNLDVRLDDRDRPSPRRLSITRNSLLTPSVGKHEQELRSGVVMLGTILLIILILILIGALPTWPYSGGWGYYPSGGFGLLVVVVIILLLMGRI